MRDKIQVLVLSLVVLIVAAVPCTFWSEGKQLSEATTVVTNNYEVVEPVTEEPPAQEYSDDVKLIALVTMAEAENQPEEGQRLVISTILNRAEFKGTVRTIPDVIYQKGAFSSIWNGRVDRCVVKDELCELVLSEMTSRTNYDVYFFSAGGYSKYGVPMFKVGDHYFSSYN